MLKFILNLISIFIILFCGVLAQDISLPTLPYPIFGYISFEGEKVDGAEITAINFRTGDKLYTISSDGGEYVIELANFQNGYEDKDIIKIQVCYKGFCAYPSLEVIKEREGLAKDMNIYVNPKEYKECYIYFPIDFTVEDPGDLYSTCFDIIFLDTGKVYYNKCYFDIGKPKFRVNESICIDLWPYGTYWVHQNSTDIANNTETSNLLFNRTKTFFEFPPLNFKKETRENETKEETNTTTIINNFYDVTNYIVNNTTNYFYNIKNYFLELKLEIKIISVSLITIILLFKKKIKKLMIKIKVSITKRIR